MTTVIYGTIFGVLVVLSMLYLIFGGHEPPGWRELRRQHDAARRARRPQLPRRLP